MFLRSWLCRPSVAHSFKTSADRRRRPRLEPLEDRQLLSGGATDVLNVGDQGDNTIKQFDANTGAYLRTLVGTDAGILGPRGIINGSSGKLLVVNQNVGTTINGEVLRFNSQNGQFLGALVPSSSPDAPFAPRGMVVKDNVAYVANFQDGDDITLSGEVKEYDANNGNFLGTLFPGNFTTQWNPRGVVFGPDGQLYVSSYQTGNLLAGYVVKFDTATGASSIVAFNNGDNKKDPGETQDLHRPEGLTFGPDGNLYVTSFRADKNDNDRILILDGSSGSLKDQIALDQAREPRSFAQAIEFGPDGKLFVPISGNGPKTGSVRSYDVMTKTYTTFVAPGGPLVAGWFLSFGKTDPATLAYDAKSGPASAASVEPVTMSAFGIAPLVDMSLPELGFINLIRKRVGR
jgi:WD40 repeat protein